MENGSTLLNPPEDAHWQGPPGPKLLIEPEPAYRIFFGNLADTILRRPPPFVPITSKPGPYWRDVFVYSGVPWWGLMESMLWHALGILLIFALSQAWQRKEQEQQLRRLARNSYVMYYTPAPTFPAIGGRRQKASAPKEQKAAQPKSPVQQAMRVTPQSENRPGGLVTPPDIAELTKRTELPSAALSTGAAPEMPLSATTPSRLTGPAGNASVVGPPPEVVQASSWQQGAMQVSVVAPPPEVKIASARRDMASPGAGAVAPAPSVQGSAARTGRLGGINVGRVDVVAPSPQLPMHERHGGSGLGQDGVSGAGVLVVPPPPSVRGTGTRGAGAGSLGGSSLAAVPPAPSIEGAGASGRGGAGLLPGSGSLLGVPPPPSVDGVGGTNGRGGRGPGGGMGMGSGSGLAVVPPAPSADGVGAANGRGSQGPGGGMGIGGGYGLGAVPPAPSADGVGGMSGRGGQGLGGGAGMGGGYGLGAVPPAPSIDGAGGANGRGNMGFGGGSGLAAVPPAPSLEGAGGGNGRGGMASLSNGSSAVVPPPPAVDDASKSNNDPGLNGVVELHMRIVGLAFALPGTSFSSSYEVFIAERQINSHQSQLIKLVYWFLPYQRRLSEYHPDYTKMYRLRVTRDAACDESLLHMSQSPAGQIFDPSQLAARSQPLNPEDQNTVLPCYRTTADDYRKAMSSRGH